MLTARSLWTFLLLLAAQALAVGVLARGPSDARLRATALVALVVSGLTWTRFSKSIEGEVLIELGPDRGLAVADLLLAPSVLLAVALLLHRRLAK